MNCKNCGAPMDLVPGRDYFFCEYCSSYAFPDKAGDGVTVLGEESDLACPVCSATLLSASVGGARALHCGKCKGILADQATFLIIVKHLRAHASGPAVSQPPVNQEELQRQTQCPRCGQLMDTHPYYGPGNVVIDVCPRCAVIWLDYGELSDIVDAPGSDRRRVDELPWSLR